MARHLQREVLQVTEPSIRPIAFDTWRRYPFSLRRWLVYGVEIAVAAIGIWLVRGSWWSVAIVAVILGFDYAWTCWRVSTEPDSSSAR